MNIYYEQNQQGLLFFVIYGTNMSSNFIKIYMDGFETQRAFYRVKDTQNRVQMKKLWSSKVRGHT